jgi:hypothetical protein
MNKKEFNEWYDGEEAQGKRWTECPKCKMISMAKPNSIKGCPNCKKSFMATITRKKPIIVLDERHLP